MAGVGVVVVNMAVRTCVGEVVFVAVPMAVGHECSCP